ncbi:Flp family type IVb pilin [Stieleria marina]|uniref:Flp/Fap pilin component n=1 Tax=Stieleria marina TaxID=1930275 RepID=A0A517NPB7_9BACT|nr:Flp/Fap pilin component [Planctomycetes bacterium K23_9]
MSLRRTRNAIIEFLREEDGPTAVEYAVMLGLIIAVAVGSVQFMAAQTIQSFEDSGNAIAGAFN